MLSPVQVPEHLMTAAAGRAEIGANQLSAPRLRPVLAEFGAQFANMFAVVLMVAARSPSRPMPSPPPEVPPTSCWRSGFWGRATERRHRFRAGACRGADGWGAAGAGPGRPPSRPRPEGATFGPV